MVKWQKLKQRILYINYIHKGGYMNEHYIQGDVFIIKVLKLPKGAKKKGTNILVEGESTGHAHRLREGEVFEYHNRLFLQTYVPTTIIHEEHDEIPIEVPGIYEIKRQRQYKGHNMTALVID